MSDEAAKLYENTVSRIQSILDNVKKRPGAFLRKDVENLKVYVSNEIRRLRPGLLEKHLEQKEMRS